MPTAISIKIKYLLKISLQLAPSIEIKYLLKMSLQPISSILQIKEVPYILFKIQSGEDINHLFNINDKLNI
jgi:hypothetical protein